MATESQVVDAIHGDIHFTPQLRGVIDTSSFQRLRQLKQLGMGHLTYPNATHTRFAHSLGVLGIMNKVASVARESIRLTETDVEDLKLAGLLHDLGHYPYSHLMEYVDKVQTTAEFLGDRQVMEVTAVPYPSHEELGELILTTQDDLIKAVGGIERARRIADIFTGKSEENRLRKLIHSSLDMDRLDYLKRDAHATGVPYGMIDLNYLLNSLRVGDSGTLGIDFKALSAAEHFLFARFFMYRTVYYHKTTFGMEQMCAQLLRMLREQSYPGLAKDGAAIREIVTSGELREFTDSYVDKIIADVGGHADNTVRRFAGAILNRRPPKLIKEVPIVKEHAQRHHEGTAFRKECQYSLRALAKSAGMDLAQFIYCETPQLRLEPRGSTIPAADARNLAPEEREDLIKVFPRGATEPVSLVDMEEGIARPAAGYFFQAFRLYFVPDDPIQETAIPRLKQEVADWDKA